MKKTIYTLPVLALALLSSCYDSDYTIDEKNRMVGDMKTLPAKIDEANQTLSLGSETWSDTNLYFQLCRSKDFSNAEKYNINYKDAQYIPLGELNGTYYFRAFMAVKGDTVYAPNVESFSIDNSLSISSVNPVKETTYQLECTSDYYWSTYFRLSTDADFKDYKDYYAEQKSYDESLKYYEYYAYTNNLSRGTTYYVKAIRDVILGTAESKVESFTTDDFLKMGEVTYSGWDGNQYPFSDGYDHFMANLMYNTDDIEDNIEIYYTGNSWEMAKDITPRGFGELWAFYSDSKQNSNHEIEVQTYKYEDNVLMWGMAKVDGGAVSSLRLRNQLARVVFHVTVADDYPVDKPEIDQFIIDGNTLPTTATFQVNGGGFVYNQWSFSETLTYRKPTTLSKGETVDIVLYSIPTSESGSATVTMYLTNTRFASDMEIDWKAGNTYEYSLKISAAALQVFVGSVTEWQPIEGGSIIINPKK